MSKKRRDKAYLRDIHESMEMIGLYQANQRTIERKIGLSMTMKREEN